MIMRHGVSQAFVYVFTIAGSLSPEMIQAVHPRSPETIISGGAFVVGSISLVHRWSVNDDRGRLMSTLLGRCPFGDRFKFPNVTSKLLNEFWTMHKANCIPKSARGRPIVHARRWEAICNSILFRSYIQFIPLVDGGELSN
ncbi:hypothetical protein D918_04423 [Trichuris suis]|nr:hypothetical protein D918_04423 [Trichuris suis]